MQKNKNKNYGSQNRIIKYLTSQDSRLNYEINCEYEQVYEVFVHL